MELTKPTNKLAHILDLHCRCPIAGWKTSRGECRVERLTPARISPLLREDRELPRPYRLHWVRVPGESILMERVSRDFATLDQLFDWAQERRIAPEEVQMVMEI